MNVDTDTQKTETIADILREMRDRAITKIGGRTITARNFVPQETCESWADRLNAALAREAELADDDQFASHHLREAAKKVLPEAVLEVLRAFHDAHYSVFPRDELTERLCHAYHDQFVADAPACNAAAMREALEAFQTWYEEVRSYVYHSVKLATAVDKMRAALSRPARNCDIYGDEDDAFAAWHDALNDGDVVSVRNAFAWLFAKAKGGAE